MRHKLLKISNITCRNVPKREEDSSSSIFTIYGNREISLVRFVVVASCSIDILLILSQYILVVHL